MKKTAIAGWHIITWTNKMDSWGRVRDPEQWYQQTWQGMKFKDAAYRLEKLRELEAKGCITNIKHVYEE